MVEANEQNRGARSVLQVPNFRTLWVGQAISQIGDGLTSLALLIVVNQLTGSTVALAGVAIALALPQLVFGIGAGVLVDRWDRRRTMIVSDLLRGMIVLGFIFVRDPSQVWLFYILAFLQAAVGTFFEPAKNALIPQLVQGRDLLAANALSQTTRVVTGVLGTALAGVLIGIAGNGLPAFSLDALSFLVSALFIWRIVLPKSVSMTAAYAEQNAFVQIREGLRFILHNRLVAAAMFTSAVTMLGLGAVNVLFVPFLINVLNTPIAALGFLEAAQVIGMVVGSMVVAALAARFKVRALIAGGVFALGTLVILIGAAPNAWFIGALLGLVGLVVTPIQASVATLMQREVPNAMLGRVGSVVSTAITLSSVLSMAGAGALGEMIGIREVFYLAGGIALIAALLALILMREPAVGRAMPVHAAGILPKTGDIVATTAQSGPPSAT